MDKIIITDLEVEARIGITEAERARVQRLLITVELERNLAVAGRADTETATTAYDRIADLIRQVVSERPRQLIEAVAESIAQAILSRRLANAVVIKVKKFSVPGTRHVSVEIRRRAGRANRVDPGESNP